MASLLKFAYKVNSKPQKIGVWTPIYSPSKILHLKVFHSNSKARHFHCRGYNTSVYGHCRGTQETYIQPRGLMKPCAGRPNEKDPSIIMDMKDLHRLAKQLDHAIL